jgi:hypothetical protein
VHAAAICPVAGDNKRTTRKLPEQPGCGLVRWAGRSGAAPCAMTKP